MLHVLLLRDDECATCDEVLAELESLKGRFPEMRIRQRRLDEEPEVASRLGVIATPAIVVNDQLAFQGHADREFLVTYLKNVQDGKHDDPYAYPPEDERDPEAVGGDEALGSMDPEWRGSGRRPSFGSNPGGRH